MVKAVTDGLLIFISFVLAYFLRFMASIFAAPHRIPFDQYFGVLVFITLLWLALFQLFGVYEERKPHSSMIDELAGLFMAVSLASLFLLGLLFLYRGFWFSRLVILNAWIISFILLSLNRLIGLWFSRFLFKRGIGIKRTLIVGAGEMGQALALKILTDKFSGRKVVGYLDDDPVKQGKTYHEIKVVGQVRDLRAVIRKSGAQEVVFASSRIPHQTILDLITECETLQVEFKIVPGMLELMASRVDVDAIGGIPLVAISEIGLKGFKAVVKRSTDIAFSSIFILLFSPILLAAAAAVKIDSKGPLIFAQKRVGKDGKLFYMYKFRSMVEGAEEMLSELEARSETEGHIFKIKEDPRMTRVGRFIRRFSIDELPQLFNVLKGDMSLVGPRPPLPKEVEKYSSWHMKRLRVAPGITGLWQVSGRSLLPFEDMVRLDIYYIENWSLWQDFKILCRTLPVVLTSSGAF